MLKKTIEFTDLDGNKVTEDFYFHLTKADVAKMELSMEGGFSEHLKKIVESGNGGLILSTFEEIIRSAVGRRHENGRQFIKNQEITDEFMQSEAYSEMFLELVTNAEAGAEFVKAVMPSDLVERAEQGRPLVEDLPLPSFNEEIEKKFEDPNWVPDNKDLAKMTSEQIQRAFARKA